MRPIEARCQTIKALSPRRSHLSGPATGSRLVAGAVVCDVSSLAGRVLLRVLASITTALAALRFRQLMPNLARVPVAARLHLSSVGLPRACRAVAFRVLRESLTFSPHASRISACFSLRCSSFLRPYLSLVWRWLSSPSVGLSAPLLWSWDCSAPPPPLGRPVQT